MILLNTMRGNCERALNESTDVPETLNRFSDILSWRVPPQSFQIVEGPVLR
jgi:hypothetical protein